jgi:hypothetical protein
MHIIFLVLFYVLILIILLHIWVKNHQGGKLQVWFYDEKTWKL